MIKIIYIILVMEVEKCVQKFQELYEEKKKEKTYNVLRSKIYTFKKWGKTCKAFFK